MEGHHKLLEIARRETGLSDYGGTAFLEGLEILVDSLNREGQLNALGEQVLRQRILLHLRQRLQIEDWYRRYPELEDVPIESPLIGISLPRTGSTALSFLLAEDPNARSLRRMEAAQPCPPPGAPRADSKRIDHDAAMQRAAGLKPHVPSGDDAPAECLDLMALDFKSHIFQAFAQIPSYSRWLLRADLGSTYAYQRRVLKLLQWRLPNRPWRLKCPTHLIYLAALNSAFPDARFVMTHRDPAQVMRSVIDVYADIVGRFTERLDLAYLSELNIRQWSEGMKRTLAFRSAGNSERFFDIHFEAMQRAPIEQVIRLYRWLGEPVSHDFEEGMARWWKHNEESRSANDDARHIADELDPERLRPLFADYVAQMNAWTHGETQ